VSATAPGGSTLDGNEAVVAAGARREQHRGPCFRTHDNRTAYAFVFYPFVHSGSFTLPTQDLRAATQAALPAVGPSV